MLKTCFRSVGIVVLLLDQLSHYAAEGLDAQRERSHVQQQNILHVAREDAALNCGAYGHNFVGIHALVRVLAKDAL